MSALFLAIYFIISPSKAFEIFHPAFKALYFYFTDIVSDHTVADVDAGRNIKGIVDSNNKYSYTYDEIGFVLLPIILALAAIICATDYSSNEEAAFLRSKIKGKHSNSYIGFLYSQSDYDF